MRRSVRHALDGQLPARRHVSRPIGRGRLPARPVHRGQFAAAQQQQPRRQSAAADDPVPAPGRDRPPAPALRLPARHRSGRADRSSARRGSRARRGASRRCARFGTTLSTSVQADRQGPSITTRSPDARTLSNRSMNGPTCPPGLPRMRTSARASSVAKAHSATASSSGEDDPRDGQLLPHPFRRWPRSVGKPMPAASKPPSTAKICPVM